MASFEDDDKNVKENWDDDLDENKQDKDLKAEFSADSEELDSDDEDTRLFTSQMDVQIGENDSEDLKEYENEIDAETVLPTDEAIRGPIDGDEELQRLVDVVIEKTDKNFSLLLKPRYLNLVAEFGDAVPFLIDGDALLLEILGDQDLGWLVRGAQYLHLVYLVERYLMLFTDKGGICHLVFFKDHMHIWHNFPSCVLAREALILHFMHNTNIKVLCEFRDPFDPKWMRYAKEESPSFMILSDGDNVKWLRDEQWIRYLMQMQVFACLGLGMNCAFTSDFEVTASRLFGFHIISFPTHIHFFSKMYNKLRFVWCVIMANLNRSGSEITVPSNLQDQNLVTGDIRDVTAVTAISCMMKELNDKEEDSCINTEEHVSSCPPLMQDLMKLYLLHLCALKTLPLPLRAQTFENENACESAIPSEYSDAYEVFLRKFQYYSAVLLRQVRKNSQSHQTTSYESVSDIMDERLLRKILELHFALSARNGEVITSLEAQAQGLWNQAIELASLQSSACITKEFHPVLSRHHHGTSQMTVTKAAKSAPFPSSMESTRNGVLTTGLLPVHNELIEEFAGEILRDEAVQILDPSDKVVKKILARGNDFDERYHWHSGKPLSDDYDRTKQSFTEKLPEDKFLRKRELRQRQKYMDWMNYYGSSLERGMLKAEVITLDPARKQTKSHLQDGADRTKQKIPHQQKPKGNKKESGKKEKIIQENKKKSEDEELKKEKKRWDNFASEIEEFRLRGDLSKAKESILTFLEKCKAPSIQTKAQMQLTKCYYMELMDQKAAGTLKPAYAVDLVKTIQDLMEDYSEYLSVRNKSQLARYMNRLGFYDQAKVIDPDSTQERNDELDLQMTYSRFQLEHMGKYLRRDQRTDADPRVKHFTPDTWQRKLLDVVDRKQSALIVAPTSSGKTYASYYCIERVLRESHDGVVVYVSPTKALVNQVAATVYARFRRKQLPPGQSVYGVFTRDYRHNVLNSQVLITVPQCLEILLLSPRRQNWASRVQYVIFDEVHCLGSEIGAEVWEHLILLISSPFLALSATVSNPEQLLRWFQNAEDMRYKHDAADKILRGNRSSYQVQLVVHNERYSDLEKFVYDGKSLLPINPVGMLTYKQLQKKSEIVGNIPLTPSETLQFYDVMNSISGHSDQELEALKPDNYFSGLIRKPDARGYEKLVKSQMMSWVANGAKDKVKEAINHFSVDSLNDDADVKDSFIDLIMKLKQEDKVPVIVFSDNRRFCEALVMLMVGHLEEEEVKLRASPKYRNIIKMKQGKLRLQKEKGKAERDQIVRKIDQIDVEDEEDFSILFEPLPECSLFKKGALSKEDKDYIMNRRLRSLPEDDYFKRGLQRGISYHHAGMNNPMRTSVEILFRIKHVQVVVATGTLALGINMPCKTVVFAQDSVYLNSLEYQQRSGRAGRRGYDLAGNVVFFGLPMRKIERLLTAELPLLKGNFPLNVTFILRLLLLVSKANDKRDAMRKAMRVLSQPLFSIDNEQCQRQLQIYFLFSVQLLLRQGYIDLHGVPQGLAGLATHLHYHEPANFVLIMLLQKGLFHQLCVPKSDGKFSEDVMKTMVIVLANLFGRRPIHANYLRRGGPRNSRVILDDLPKAFAKAIKNHNEMVDEVFDVYVRQLSQHVKKKLGQEHKLPLSKIGFITKLEAECDEFVSQLEESAFSDGVSSIFTALSGKRGKYQHGQDDLIHKLRPEVYTDVSAIPKLEIKPHNHHGKEIFLNGYAFDFFLHGSLNCISRDNGILEGEVYRLLQDFKLLIDSISVSLLELGPEKDTVVCAFQQLSEEYGKKFEEGKNK